MSTSLLYHGFSIRGYQFQRCLFILLRLRIDEGYMSKVTI